MVRCGAVACSISARPLGRLLPSVRRRACDRYPLSNSILRWHHDHAGVLEESHAQANAAGLHVDDLHWRRTAQHIVHLANWREYTMYGRSYYRVC